MCPSGNRRPPSPPACPRPIGLRLFARRGLETRGKFRGHLAAQPIKESAHDTHRAGKAHFSDLLAKTHPGETKLFKALLEVILEGIEL
jgi:hypothetical protein